MTTAMEILPVSVEESPTPSHDEQVTCALTGKMISATEAYWAPPLITTSQLVSTTLRVLFTAPGMLGHVLFGEQPNVPYDPDVREELAARRSAEQLKLLVGLLVVVALIVLPIVLLTMR